jgi:hypothetical protein
MRMDPRQERSQRFRSVRAARLIVLDHKSDTIFIGSRGCISDEYKFYTFAIGSDVVSKSWSCRWKLWRQWRP